MLSIIVVDLDVTLEECNIMGRNACVDKDSVS